jgi:hypothetical protein
MPPGPPRTRLRLTGSSVIVAMAAGVPLRASAAPGCSLQAIPEHPSTTWEEAIAHARTTLASRSGDCGGIVVEVEGDFATLKFTTTDGRRAVRVLHDASELSPVLGALLVTLPAPPPVPAPPSEPVRQAQSLRAPVAERPPPAAAPVHALVSVLAGGRFAGPGPLLGPTVILGAGIGLPHWELGLTAQWTPAYAVLTDDATRPARLAGISAGLAVGRRTPLSEDLALVTGMTLSGAAQHEGWRTPDATTGKMLHDESDRGQALVGAYAAAVFPATARMRLRSSLLGDVDATHLGENEAPANGVPRLPWWALTLAFGVESEVL